MRPGWIPVMVLALTGCGGVVEGTKDALNKGGELAGRAASEVVEGVATGVEKTWSIDVVLSEELRSKGLSAGRTQVEVDSMGMANRLIVYLIAAHGCTDTLHAVATDEEGREMGRSSLVVSLASGSADYHTFRFQDRTDLERKSRIDIR